ncbi:acyltransferase, partial [Prauserella oleivorans]
VRVVVAGDSHAQQYVAALRPIARGAQRAGDLDGPRWVSFLDGHRARPHRHRVGEVEPAAGEIAGLRPDTVFAMATRDARPRLADMDPARL